MCDLSVIIPGYNTPDDGWIRSVKSVLSLIGKMDEVICVDDCSLTRPKCLDVLAKEDSRVKLVRLDTNSGQAKARNIGLSIAKGRYIAFCDSDDEVFHDIYAKCLAKAEETNADIVVYGVETIWVNNGLMKVDATSDQFLGALSKDSLLNLHGRCLFNYPWNKIYRKAFLVNNSILFNEKAIPREDEVFNLICVLFHAKWATIADVGQKYYRADGTSLSRYRRYGSGPSRIVAETWEKCWHDVYTESPPKKFRIDELDLQREEWRNMWLRESPYSLRHRWRWLMLHPQLGGFCEFFKMVISVFFRSHFYFRPIRRWHIKRLYPYATDIY